ncbi:hypothetical protein QFZ79_002946 [Arthrobacter sp. V4I6]|uniref:hypothetical protein n=1 Tax=Arthrobacter sp. V4I6 TaxID=3042281 RepID=UPI002789A354|nr:hypothetical protein [Arthrobacter sp. V4I6]MDQ0854835.1 hypothetical protein [Arthrobacter sp. V4I6]
MKPLTVGNDYHSDILKRFNRDVEEHEMTVLHDDGLYRHLRFAAPKTSIGWFSIITTPGQLTIFGDMGTFVFARLQDMFEFFMGNGYVNAGYWAEKLQAVDRNSDVREHSEDLFKRWVLENFWEQREEYEPDVAAQIWADIRDSLFDPYEDTSAAGRHALLARFHSSGFQYHDSWELNWDEYGFRFLWCCHAILAGIRHYNEARLAVAA